MGQITVRFEEEDLQDMDSLLRKQGLGTRSELLRRAWNVYRTIKKAESEGRVAVMMPADQIKTAPIQITL